MGSEMCIRDRIAVVGVSCLRVAEDGADYFLIGHDVRIADAEVYEIGLF